MIVGPFYIVNMNMICSLFLHPILNCNCSSFPILLWNLPITTIINICIGKCMYHTSNSPYSVSWIMLDHFYKVSCACWIRFNSSHLLWRAAVEDILFVLASYLEDLLETPGIIKWLEEEDWGCSKGMKVFEEHAFP